MIGQAALAYARRRLSDRKLPIAKRIAAEDGSGTTGFSDSPTTVISKGDSKLVSISKLFPEKNVVKAGPAAGASRNKSNVSPIERLLVSTVISRNAPLTGVALPIVNTLVCASGKLAPGAMVAPPKAPVGVNETNVGPVSVPLNGGLAPPSPKTAVRLKLSALPVPVAERVIVSLVPTPTVGVAKMLTCALALLAKASINSAKTVLPVFIFDTDKTSS